MGTRWQSFFFLWLVRLGTNNDEEDSVSATLSDFDSPPIENPPVYQNQLRVLTILNDDFEIDWDSLYNEFILSKNWTKKKISKIILPSLRKTMLKENG